MNVVEYLQENRLIYVQEIQDDRSSLDTTTYYNKIEILNPSMEKDSGVYACKVISGFKENSHQQNIKVIGRDESVIDIWEPTGRYEAIVSSKKPSIKWNVKVNGKPKPTSYWLNNKNEEIRPSHGSESNKYTVKTTDTESALTIRNPNLGDAGEYTLFAENGKSSSKKKFTLRVRGMYRIAMEISRLFIVRISTAPPRVHLEDVYVTGSRPVNLTCEVVGYPTSIIKWSFRPCFDNSCELQNFSVRFPFGFRRFL